MTSGSNQQERARQTGVQDALLEMYPALLAFFRRRLPAHRREEACDLTQETLLAAWTTLMRDKGGQVESLVSYVLGIARHKWNDALRENHRERALPVEERVDDGFPSRLGEVSVERRLLDAEWRVRWVRAISKLKPLQREVLRLRFLEQLSNDEACRRLHLAPADGSRLKYRALEKLRFLLRIDKPGRR